MRRILVADDDPALRGLLRIVAKRAGFEVETASDGADALKRLQEKNFDIAVIDLMMPRVSGYEVLQYVGTMSTRPVVVVVTAMNDAHLPQLDGKIVTSIFRKPFDVEMLSAALLEIAETMVESDNEERKGSENVIDFRQS